MVGPLATYAEPHAYDLCDQHSERLSAPRGWEVLRLVNDDRQGPTSDDLEALADAVREAAQPRAVEVPLASVANSVGTRRRHLRSLPSDD